MAVTFLQQRAESAGTVTSVLWKDPTDLASRDLYYGPGGKAHQPRGAKFSFIKEDLAGTNPKFDVRDDSGVKWRIKLGGEAQPETVATRLIWAVGYITDEDYFLPDLHVSEMPPKLRRGGNLVGTDGAIRDARLKRIAEGDKKIGRWRWRDSPFTDSRELNGLRVLMALLNNWDLKDENNAIRLRDGVRNYMVSDLGACFGFVSLHQHARSDLKAYGNSKFISHITPEYVDLAVPARPRPFYVFNLPVYVRRVRLRWIGRGIPRGDARWIGQLLGRLSSAQVRDAFRAGGYSHEQTEAFSKVVESRIAELSRL